MQNQFKQWLSEITNNRNYEYIEPIRGKNGPSNWSETIKIYTHDYSYSITAKIDGHHTYLGCIMSCRKPRAGEDWNRGRDLPGGPMNQKTWDKIKTAIINNELVKVAKARRTHVNTEVMSDGR